jgi:hypothetical protein
VATRRQQLEVAPPADALPRNARPDGHGKKRPKEPAGGNYLGLDIPPRPSKKQKDNLLLYARGSDFLSGHPAAQAAVRPGRKTNSIYER